MAPQKLFGSAITSDQQGMTWRKGVNFVAFFDALSRENWQNLRTVEFCGHERYKKKEDERSQASQISDAAAQALARITRASSNNGNDANKLKSNILLFNVLHVLVHLAIIWIVAFFIKALGRISKDDIQVLQRASRSGGKAILGVG